MPTVLPRPVSARLLVVCCCLAASFQPARADEREQFFEKQIRPLLIDNCVSCHGPDKQEGDLRLDSRQQMLVGTNDVGALVKPGHADESRLLQVIQYSEDDTQMPPKAKLSDRQIDLVRHWIGEGAVWPEAHDFGAANAVDVNAWQQHWAFQPIADPPIPEIPDAAQHPIDRFVRQRLMAEGISPSRPADGRTLVRRLSYAIIGLPPTLDDLNAVDGLDDAALQDWLTQYADRLLATPQFGERWARYWLDIARYADTKGYVFQEDRNYKDAWRYREWVIKSLNDDMPYDEFLTRQIAADRMAGSDDPAQLAAMGFLTLGRRFLNNKHDIIDDRIDVLSRGTMAMTVACARCHDHKFDPIPTADYYSLYGVFASSHEPKEGKSPLQLADLPKPHEPYVFVRGGAGNRGPKVSRHFLTALSEGQPAPFTDGSGRLELAKEIASPQNPLTARVAVNRIWLRLFGHGLVDSPSDFGVRTAPPSHPELLDHLATYFINHNWSRKAVIRYILQSATWRQSSAPREDVAQRDPENRLLARMARRRLDFEAFRDSVLSVAGNLDATIGGESADITSEPFTNRRTVYAQIDRQNLPGVFRTFDFASPDTHAPKRFETTVPQQALFQLNSPFIMEQARRSADAVADQPDSDAVNNLYQAILKRQPEAQEVAAAAQFLTTAREVVPKGTASSGWHYGYAEITPEMNRVLKFEPFPVFHENRWAGGSKLPDPKLGWCSLSSKGGHAGGDLGRCPDRRWVSDRDCQIRIESTLKHASEKGDGVSGHVISAGQPVQSAFAHNKSVNLNVDEVDLKAGDVVDFVIHCGANESFDSFDWKIVIKQSVDGTIVRTWDSVSEFSGARSSDRLSPAAQLAQTLLLTNEFLFVD